LAIGATVLFVVVAVFVTTGTTQQSDTAILTAIHSHSSPFLDAAVPKLTLAGEPLLVGVIAVMVTVGLLYARRFSSAAIVGCGVLGALALNYVIKQLFERPRPELWERLVTETSYSFPSGHATASAALALVMVAVLWHTKWRWHGIVLAAMYMFVVGLTRLYLGVHYPSDVIAGWCVAAVWVGAVVLLAMRPVVSEKSPETHQEILC
jgi:undecaprenyl-diphosphatase